MPDAKTQLADLELSRRLERAEGLTNAAMIDARARLFPATGACFLTRS